MTVNIQYKGTDLASIFENPALGTLHANVNYQSAGTDIANTFTNLASVSVANGNIASRIPPTGILTSAGTDFSSIFAGASSNWTLTTPLAPTHTGFTSPTTLTHTFTVTFASAAALTSYFNYGGRITIGPTQSAGTVADTDLNAMFTQIGKVVIFDVGTYITGAGSGITVNNPNVGGTNIGTTQTTLVTATEATTYTSNTYTVKITANAAAGSATVLTITAILGIVTHGTVVDSYTGTYTSTIQQRNYTGVVTPTQSAPTFATTVAP
jgi:hypothetical protein